MSVAIFSLCVYVPTTAASQLTAPAHPVRAQAGNRPDTAECLGARPTVIVEAGMVWNGSDADDVVVVSGTGAIVSTEGGDDRICVYNTTYHKGFNGSQVFSGLGNDTVITYGGSNDVDTSEGNDLVYLNGEDETATTAEGDDHIWGLGTHTLSAYGGSGNDLIAGSPGNDSLNGGSDNDVLLGNGGDDHLVELYGDNKLYGGSGQDTLDGGADHDLCHDTDEDTVFNHCEDILQPPAPPLPEAG